MRLLPVEADIHLGRAPVARDDTDGHAFGFQDRALLHMQLDITGRHRRRLVRAEISDRVKRLRQRQARRRRDSPVRPSV